MATAPKSSVVPTVPDGQTRLSEDARFEGQWRGADISVQGRVEGELTLTGWLRIGRSGAVLGRVRADSVEIGGEFTGEIRARLIVLNESARARGTFLSERLIIKEGARVDGAFDRPPETPATSKAPAPVVLVPAGARPSGEGAAPASGEAAPEKKPGEGGAPAPAG